MTINQNNPLIPLTINQLVIEGIIPKDKTFDITEEMISEYIAVYDNLKQKYNPNTTSLKNNKNRIGFEFARKLAGLSLVKMKLDLGSKCKEGFLYRIGNPAWKDYLKIGITTDIYKRLASYQTYSPKRDYYIISYDFLLNKREVEAYFLTKYKIDTNMGEWINSNLASQITKEIRTQFILG